MIQKSRGDCIGCKTHFEEGTKLPLEGLSVEFKNYMIPIRDQKHRWVLLKTIVSFLNCKGGTIFIGVEDSTGEVVGISMQRKEQDDFKLFLQQLTARIQPTIDLSDREDVAVQYLPVIKNGKFIGKYLIKILVKQGSPSELYCFSQKVTLQAANDKKIDEFEAVYSYVRSNMSACSEIKGYQLLLQAKKKALAPSQTVVSFHEDCNPEPVILEYEITKLGFSKVGDQNLREILEGWFGGFLKELQVQAELISFDEENQMIVIQFESKADFVKVEAFVTKNVAQLNSSLQGLVSFVKKGEFLDCIVFENSLPKPKPIEEVQKKPEKGRKQNLIEFHEDIDSTQQPIRKQQRAPQKPKQQQKVLEKKTQSVQPKPQPKLQQKGNTIFSQSPQKNTQGRFNRSHSYTFTHINPKQKNELGEYLSVLCGFECKIDYYENTLQIFLPTEEKLFEFLDEVVKNMYEIQQYGFKNTIRHGINVSRIDIQNFDRRRAKDMTKFLSGLIGKDLKKMETFSQGNRVVLAMLINGKRAACEWLDRLLMEKRLKQFQIPGAQKGESAKMKIFLICQGNQEIM